MILELPGVDPGTPDRRLTLGFFHFSNNNLAVRKACIRDVGDYDEAVPSSEDVDLCFRVALSRDWVACREPGVRIRHKARGDVRGLVRQMWGWGRHLAGPYQRARRKGLFLYLVSSKGNHIQRALEWPRFPLYVVAMPTVFHGMHAAALLALACGVAGFVPGVLAAALATLLLARRWAAPALAFRGSPGRRVRIVVLHYLANAAFLGAAFVGGLRRGMVLVPASILPPRASMRS